MCRYCLHDEGEFCCVDIVYTMKENFVKQTVFIRWRRISLYTYLLYSEEEFRCIDIPYTMKQNVAYRIFLTRWSRIPLYGHYGNDKIIPPKEKFTFHLHFIGASKNFPLRLKNFSPYFLLCRGRKYFILAGGGMLNLRVHAVNFFFSSPLFG